MNEIEKKSDKSNEKKDETQPEQEAEPVTTKPSEPVKKPKAESPPKNWRDAATFFVSFGYVKNKGGEEQLHTKAQLRGGKAKQWEGLATNELIQWMVSQADLPLPPEPEPDVEDQPLVEVSQPAEPETVLEIARLSVSEVSVPALAGIFLGVSLLQAEGHLSISGPEAARLTNDGLSFNVELYLINTTTQESKLVAAQPGQFAPGELSYQLQQNFPIPAAGRYQLYAVASLLPPSEAVAHIQGPIIRVEP
jgi:hypothetical protein